MYTGVSQGARELASLKAARAEAPRQPVPGAWKLQVRVPDGGQGERERVRSGSGQVAAEGVRGQRRRRGPGASRARAGTPRRKPRRRAPHKALARTGVAAGGARRDARAGAGRGHGIGRIRVGVEKVNGHILDGDGAGAGVPHDHRALGDGGAVLVVRVESVERHVGERAGGLRGAQRARRGGGRGREREAWSGWARGDGGGVGGWVGGWVGWVSLGWVRLGESMKQAVLARRLPGEAAARMRSALGPELDGSPMLRRPAPRAPVRT
jgi:hypothetical protein